MTPRQLTAGGWQLAVAFLLAQSACARGKPESDTAATLPAPDTVGAPRAAEPDSTRLMKQADTKGAATKGTPQLTPRKELGRDSVIKPGPGNPVIAIPVDSVRKRPPRP